LDDVISYIDDYWLKLFKSSTHLENPSGRIKTIELRRELKPLYCPLGQNTEYSLRLRCVIELRDGGKLADFCEWDKAVNRLEGQSLTVEEAVALVGKITGFLFTEAKYIGVQGDYEGKTHSPVAVVYSWHLDDEPIATD